MAGQLPTNPTTIFKQSLAPGAEFSIKVDSLKPPVLKGKHKDEAISLLIDSVMNKLVRDPNVEIKKDTQTNEFSIDVDASLVNRTVDDTILSIKEAKNMLDALPDLVLVKDIIISSVLSPNDMMSTELIYSNDSTLFDDVEAELTQVVKDYFETEYKIQTYLQEWLEKALFTEGAVPMAVIAESSIDHAINSNLKITQESISSEYDNDKFKHYGFLGTPKYLSGNRVNKRKGVLSFESVSANKADYIERVGTGLEHNLLNVTVIDNPHALKLPMLKDKIRRDRISEIYGIHEFGVESFHNDVYNKEIISNHQIYPTRQTTQQSIVAIKSLDELEKETIGHPVVFYFPIESVIPIYSPADPSDHVCYFIALDEFGNPIRADQNEDQISEMRRNFQSTATGNMSSQIITTASNMGLKDVDNYSKDDINAMCQLYSKVIEKDLVERLEAGGFQGKDLKLGHATELYKLMFVRALANMNTQLLFLPKDMMTYLAFDYKPNGVGRSILDKTKTIGSLRMVNVMADAIAATKSAIDHRTLEIKLDPEDPDPMKRVEQFIHEFERATKATFPMGINSFADISDYLQKAGVQVKISGHEGMPDMGMEFNNQRYDYNKPDDDYSERLGKKHTMALGAPPESVNTTEDIQFATQIISGNIFFAKISLWRQMVFCEHLSDHLQKYTRNSQTLLDNLYQIIENNRAHLPKIDKKFSSKAAAIVFANNIRVELPKPDVAQTTMQLEAFTKYEEFLDKVLPAFVSTELFTSANLGDKASEIIDHLVSLLKAHFSREWLIKNNALPELFDLVNGTEEAVDRFDFLINHSAYLDSLTPSLREYIISNLKRAKHEDGVIEKAEELLGTEESSDYGDSGSGDSDSDSSGDSDSDGDDFGMDDSFGDESEEDDPDTDGESGSADEDEDMDWSF